MVTKTIADGLQKIADPLTNLLLVIAASILAIMMFLTATDVALRYIFNSPIPGAFELEEYMMAILVPFGLVYTAHQKAHIGVDLITEHLPERVQNIIACVTTFLCFILFVLISWQCYMFVIDQYQAEWASAVLMIPRYPFIACSSLAFAIMCLVLFIDFLNYLSKGFS